MKRTTIAATLILVILLLASAVLAAPRLVIPQSEFDFGYVPQNSKISHTFWLHSEGDDILKITRVVPG